LADRAFLVSVVIDSTGDRDAIVPDLFRAVQWTRLPAGETPPAFIERVQRLKGVQPASEYAVGHRPGRVNACTLLTRRGGGVDQTSDGGSEIHGDSCIHPRPSSTGTYSEDAELSVDWQGGLRRLRDNTAVGIRFDTTANPAWEGVCLHTMAVKPEQILAVLAKAMSRIS
jgi:hypothetical protein